MVISKITRQYHDFQRLLEILKILSRYGFGAVLHMLPMEKSILKLITQNKSFQDEAFQKISLPKRIRKIVEELGPTFIKLGQILSTRPDLIPIDICHELEGLQNQAQPFEYEKVKYIFLNDFKKYPEELFKEFNDISFAAASMSQVHNAILKTGEHVAVKIRRPEMQNIIKSDLDILYQLSQLIHSYVEESKMYNLPGIVSELKKNIIRELDFTFEAHNIIRFSSNFKDIKDVIFPNIYPYLSSEQVLVSDFLEGDKINDINALKSKQYDLKLLAKTGAKAILKQIFEDGFFHADPHPGNILVLSNEKIAFLDLGLVGRIESETLSQLAALLSHLVDRDIDGIIRLLDDLGMIDERFDTRALKTDLFDFIDRFYGLPLKHLKIEKWYKEFMSLIYTHKIKIPSSFTLLIKVLLTVDGIGRALDPDFDVILETKPFVQNLIIKQYSPQSLFKEFKNISSEFFRFTKQLPKQSIQIMSQLRNGNLKIEFVHMGLEKPLFTLSKLTDRLVLSIIISSLIIGASLITHSNFSPKFLEIPVFALIGYIIAGLLSIALLIIMIKNKNNYKD